MPAAAALRTWGLAASAAALAAALTIVALAGCNAPTTPASPAQTAAQLPPPPPIADPSAMPTPDVAEAPTPATEEPVAEAAGGTDIPPPPALSARPSFLVRFEAPHPIARAHGLAASSRMTAARNAVWAGLRQRRELDGLCFKRFTTGGNEILLEACSDVADPAAFERRWVSRFRTMRGVDYAEPNHTAQAEGRR